MNITTILFEATTIIVAGCMIYLCNRYLLPKSELQKEDFIKLNSNSTMNGLRGYAAFFIFIYHGIVWHGYLRDGIWQYPSITTYIPFGSAIVYVMLMCSGFLFTTKIIDSKHKPINWTQFYIIRLLRTAPLYLFLIGIALLMVLHETKYVLQVPLELLIKNIGLWLSFSLLGSPSVNNVEMIAITGIAWTLTYTLHFYAFLPLLALILRAKVPLPFVLFSIASAIAFYYLRGFPILASSFFLGGVAVFILKIPRLKSLLMSRAATLLAITLLIIIKIFFSGFGNIIALFLSIVIVIIIVSGNSLFGILNTRLAQSLGKYSYSIFLLHSLFLYAAFKFALGETIASKLSYSEHWFVIITCTILLIPTCYLTHRYIEIFSMRLFPIIKNKIENQITSGSGSSRMPKRS